MHQCKQVENSRANNKSCSFASAVRGLWPSSFAACNTLLSLVTIPIPVYSSPWGTSHGSGIFSSSQVSQYKARFHFHCITQWPLMASTRTPLPQVWAQRLSLTTDEYSHRPFIHLFLLTLQSEQHGQHCQVTADLGWSLATKFSAAFLHCLLGAENSSGLFTSCKAYNIYSICTIYVLFSSKLYVLCFFLACSFPLQTYK